MSHGWQSKDIDASTGVSGLLSFCLFLALLWLSMYYVLSYLSIYLSTYLSIYLSTYLSYLSSVFRHLSLQKWPETPCVSHSSLEMCFAPPLRAISGHPHLQKWSETRMFLTFWLGNVLRVTTACNSWTSELAKVVREWCVFCTFWVGNGLRATTACTISTSDLPKAVQDRQFFF